MKIHFFMTCAISLIVGNAVGVDAVNPVTAPTLFSLLVPGQSLPKNFRIVTIPKIAVNRFSLEASEGSTVLRVDSNNSAGSVAIPLAPTAAGANNLLVWRWKISHVLDKADMTTKPGDDFSARVYVFFDVPMASLSFIERSKIHLARVLAGADVPTAALCYVWDNTHPVGHTEWSPYTNRVRKIVLQSGPVNAGKWMLESRDINADFRAAFGFDAPAVTGVAVGNDTDNTHERVTTWYGDVVLKAK